MGDDMFGVGQPIHVETPLQTGDLAADRAAGQWQNRQRFCPGFSKMVDAVGVGSELRHGKGIKGINPMAS
ncbi:hypothetical protein [Parasedimentitalea marina]|uniref:hypothetical protein n=1 Tax=Parasedimentitalea marina TaxID=2483033 RepID=UPI00237B7466|nr:hypothetical protein [Parasedimentitalea marina]